MEGRSGEIPPLGLRARVVQPRVAHSILVQVLSLGGVRPDGRCVCPFRALSGGPWGQSGWWCVY